MSEKFHPFGGYRNVYFTADQNGRMVLVDSAGDTVLAEGGGTSLTGIENDGNGNLVISATTRVNGTDVLLQSHAFLALRDDGANDYAAYLDFGGTATTGSFDIKVSKDGNQRSVVAALGDQVYIGPSNGAGAVIFQCDQMSFFNGSSTARPEVPATPDAQDVVDALLTLNLVTQAAPWPTPPNASTPSIRRP